MVARLSRDPLIANVDIVAPGREIEREMPSKSLNRRNSEPVGETHLQRLPRI